MELGLQGRVAMVTGGSRGLGRQIAEALGREGCAVAICARDEAQLNAALPPGLVRLPLPYTAAFLAGSAFLEYRRRGGARRSPLPDFYIGAHAAAEGHTLLTRDATRYRTYFPNVAVIAPTEASETATTSGTR